MRTLGLIGGTTYHATTVYYSQINEHVQKRLGGLNAARIMLHSFNYAEIMAPFLAGDFDEVSRMLCTAATNLKSIGAEAIVLCVNTNHKWSGDIEKATGLPLLHIIDFTAEEIKKAGLSKIALLGTKISMEQDFLRGRLEEKHGIQVLLPPEDIRNQMNDAIFKELPQMIITDKTKKMYLDSVEDLIEQGAQGVILGCTELQFVLKPDEVSCPLFETVELHARGVAEWAVNN